MRFSLFNAAPNTGNLGVTALCYATLHGITQLHPDAEFTVFDYGRGRRKQRLNLGNGDITYHLQGAIHSRRFYRPENIRLWPFLAKLGGLGNSGIRAIQDSDAVLDISGGDSFTDLYGPERFNAVILPKLIALQLEKPLMLLPQTYGPFKSERMRSVAAEVVRKARMAWARDARSYEVLKDLLGSAFDPARHKCGVDVAFALPAIKPSGLTQSLADFLEDRSTEIIGINVSGLIYNDPENAKARFGLKSDYNRVVVDLVKRFLEETDCRVALVPHVITPKGHYESDLDACEDVARQFVGQKGSRLFVMPAFDNPCEVKWLIKKLDWFCGTRMHATIAALSSGVPVSAISYSTKTAGVFETCDQGKHVADPRSMDNEHLLGALWESWCSREGAIKRYAQTLSTVEKRVKEQAAEIVTF